MKPFQCGQLWLVNFNPSVGHEYQKIRPALVIQQNRYIPQSNLLTIIPLSSQTVKSVACDFLIPKDTQNRLMKDSLLKIYQISSFDKSRFIKYIGHLNTPLMKQVDTQIQQSLFGKASDTTNVSSTPSSTPLPGSQNSQQQEKKEEDTSR
jgi:mRNA interferase MazF